MDAFIKSFRTYRAIKKAVVLSNSLILDSLDAETSTVTVKGTQINRSDTGNWLILDKGVFHISQVKPQQDRTILTLVSPLEAFNRPLELSAPSAGQSIGGFAAGILREHWANCPDPDYSMPYLQISTSDATPYVQPELDSSGLFKPNEYLRLMRKSYGIATRFVDAGSFLLCSISKPPIDSRNVSFDTGQSQLKSVDYSSSGIAKLTVLCDVETGKKDAQGEAILERQRYTWYLAEDGRISQEVPARRAVGVWSTITVKNLEEMQAKVVEAFAKNKSSHKLEFWSTLDLNVQDVCTFNVYGELLQSYISCKRKTSEDKRFYYRSGELATTASEKLRGVIK